MLRSPIQDRYNSHRADQTSRESPQFQVDPAQPLRPPTTQNGGPLRTTTPFSLPTAFLDAPAKHLLTAPITYHTPAPAALTSPSRSTAKHTTSSIPAPPLFPSHKCHGITFQAYRTPAKPSSKTLGTRNPPQALRRSAAAAPFSSQALRYIPRRFLRGSQARHV